MAFGGKFMIVAAIKIVRRTHAFLQVLYKKL
jgi:hypothetical protein